MSRNSLHPAHVLVMLAKYKITYLSSIASSEREVYAPGTSAPKFSLYTQQLNSAYSRMRQTQKQQLLRLGAKFGGKI